ncbi:MAG: FkbM family methyltransferase [Pseudomonadota bacterium]
MNDAAYQRLLAFREYNVDLIFDVGANTGQYASEMRSSGYKGRIVSFEPLKAAFDQLAKNAGKDPAWEVHPRCAVGDSIGEVDINVSENSVSSSILPMLDQHRSSASNSVYVGVESVPLITLDSAVSGYSIEKSRYVIKIDTQGFEWSVLDGAETALRNATGVQLELSMVPLYEGQRLWRELIDRLEHEGFTLWTLQRGFTDKNNGRTLQMDGLLFRVECEA